MEFNSTLLKQSLKHYYGYEQFRPGQEEIITEILKGGPVLAILPTGGGKSLCFQLPSLLLKGITLVLSPLVSLMKDQVENLNKRGIAAAYLESGMSPTNYGKTLYKVRSGECKFLYVAPERLQNKDFLELSKQINITLVAVDEAHCISQWGPAFRPAYYAIPEFLRQRYPKPIVAAFTATATPEVRRDILEHLEISSAKTFVMGFDRPNLCFKIEHTSNKERSLLAFLEKHSREYGVVYCSTRGNVEAVTQLLKAQNYSVLRYHAGLTSEERKRNQQDFVEGKVKIIVATNAFGMGIDKADVRYVVHFNMPKDLEGYYQEAGRAGRDGERGECLLLYNEADVAINQQLIEAGCLSTDRRKKEEQLLARMQEYCQTKRCLRSYFLAYFGEVGVEHCDNCTNCLEKANRRGRSWFNIFS